MADGYISQIKTPDNKVYDFRDQHLKVYTGSCTTAAGTAIKDVITDGIFTLEKGAVLFVNFTNTNSAAVGNLKLKINSEADTNAKPIKYLVNGNDPANIPGAGYLRANQTYMFRYDGTNWVADLNYYTYSNDFANKIGHYNNILARKAIAAESLIVGDETGYEKVASGVTFNLAYPIVWCTGAVNANASNYANMFLQHYDRNIATGAKSGFTSAANKVIYLIVTINGNIATIDSNIITDTLPSSDDGKVYISLGKLGAQSTGANYFFLYPVHPMFWYKNGAIREYSGASQYALTAPLSGISGADDLKAIEGLTGTTGLLKKTATNTWTLDTSNYVTSSGITSVTIGATSPVQSSTSTAQNGSSASTTISLKDAYGDTKNPYGTKAKNLVLAGPSSGSNAVPTFRALVAADIPNSILKWQTTTAESTALYDFGVYVNNNANSSSMTSGNFFNILNVPYRKASGNTKADWGWQLGNTTANDGRLWYRTAGDNVWGDWQTIAHATQSTSDTGSSSQPVYMTKTGVIIAITAVGAAYGGTGKTTLKDSANALINALDTGSSPLTANDYVITQYVGGGTTTTTYHRRPANQVVNGTLVKAALGTVGTTAKKFLKDTGAWTQVAFSDLSGTATNAQLANSKVTIAGNDVSLGGSLSDSTLRESLGLSNALHFIGITSTTLENGSTTATLTPKTSSPSSLSKTTGFVDGDVVMDGDQLREYVWSGSAWRLLGITTSTAYTQPASTATNTWIAQISQGTDGKITATTGSLDTSGTWSGNAATATKLKDNATNRTKVFYRGDNTWSNILKQTAAAALGIDTNHKIGTAIKDLHFTVGSGSGTGINDGNAGGITIGTDTASYGGIYWQSSGSYGLRLHFATTGSFANGAYTRMLITSDGKVGIGTLTPDTLLTVNGNAKADKFIGALQGNADTATSAGKWTTARTLTIGSTGKSVDGSGNISWSLAEIGAAPASTVSCTTANVKSALSTGYDTAKFLNNKGEWAVPAYTTSLAWSAITSKPNLSTGNARIFYGTSSTAAGTAAKVVTCSIYDAYTAGDILVVKFDNANTAGSPTLNVNSKGAKNIRKIYNGAVNTLNANSEITGTCMFVYDGTQWLLTNTDYNNTYTIPTSFSITANATDGLWDLTGTNGTNAVTYALAPYSSKGTTATFYTAATNPTLTTRLNYDGYLYATKLYSGGTEVSVSGHTHSYLSSISWSGDTNLKLKQSVNGATATDVLQFAAGSNITLTGASGKLTIAGTPDTKNTAGSTNSTSKLFLIGATTQAANPTTNSYQYTYTTEGLLSSTQLGLNAAGTEKVHLEWNPTDSSLDFIFA